jgi:putative ABC transport system permease protein
VVVALGFSMAIMISIPAGIMANQAATEQVIDNYNATINNMQAEINKTLTLVECSASSGFNPQSEPPRLDPGSGLPEQGSQPGFMARTDSYINGTAVDDIEAMEGVKDVVPIFEKTEGTNKTQETPRGAFQILVPDYTIVGIPLNSSLTENHSLLPTTILQGRTLREGDSGVVLLSTNNTEYFGSGVGDEISILGKYFTVIGIYEPADTRAAINLYVNITDAQTITGLTGQLSRLDVYAQDQSYVDEIVSKIEELYPELTLTTYETRLSELERMQGIYQSTLQNAQTTITQTQSIAYQEIGIAVVATSLIVLFMMLYTVRERTHEIGVLKAIGFSNWNVMSQFMLEGTLLTIVAAAVGVAIGVFGAPVLSSILLPGLNTSTNTRPNGTVPNNQPFFQGSLLPSTTTVTLTPQLMLLAFGAAALLGAVGSLYPSWRASRTSPMEALKYE